LSRRKDSDNILPGFDRLSNPSTEKSQSMESTAVGAIVSAETEMSPRDLGSRNG
jgi:hypothetical protein